jgi:hypothetical protein
MGHIAIFIFLLAKFHCLVTKKIAQQILQRIFWGKNPIKLPYFENS